MESPKSFFIISTFQIEDLFPTFSPDSFIKSATETEDGVFERFFLPIDKYGI
jgi:hypothetical protein